MSEDNTYNINIVTNGNKKRKINESDNPSDTYILLLNEELNNQNKQLIIEMKELESEKNEIEEWLDKSDRDKKNMRDFIKTIIQTKHIQSSIINIFNDISNHYQINENINLILALFHFFLIYINVPHYICNIYIFSYIFVPQMKYKCKQKYFKNIDRYYKELSELEKSNNFLDEYIDNM